MISHNGSFDDVLDHISVYACRVKTPWDEANNKGVSRCKIKDELGPGMGWRGSILGKEWTRIKIARGVPF